MVSLMVNGFKTQCFVDTGSEVTIVKGIAAGKMGIRCENESFKRVKGVSGKTIPVLGESLVSFRVNDRICVKHKVCILDGISFPGDILLGMDLLRRFNFRLECFSDHSKVDVLVLQGQKFSVTYTDSQSLQVVLVEVHCKQPRSLPASQVAHVAVPAFVPPRSGRFVKCSVPRGMQAAKELMVSGIECPLVVPRSLQEVKNGRLKVWAVNETARPVKLRNGHRLAVVENIVQVFSLEAGSTDVGVDDKQNESDVSVCDTVKSASVGGINSESANVSVKGVVSDSAVPNKTKMINSKSAKIRKAAIPGTSFQYAAEEQALGTELFMGNDNDFELGEGFIDDDFDSFDAVGDFGSADDYILLPDVDLPPCSVVTQTPVGVDQSGSSTDCPEDVQLKDAELGDLLSEIDLGHLTLEQQQQLRQVLVKYVALFDAQGKLGTVPGISHTIKTKEGEGPLCVRQWRLPEASKKFIRKECDNMLSQGVIEHSTSPWHSPIVLVRKKDGSTRFCIDYRGLNSITEQDAYPMPRIDELIDQLHGTMWFTALDARSAYWTVDVSPDDRPKTAFSDGHRLFQFRKLPFGLATAPSTFQRAVNCVLSSVLGRHTIAYLDDVVVHSNNFDDHLRHLDETLSLLLKAGFRLNRKKCVFATDTFKFLGFKISPKGVEPDPDKVAAIQKMPQPRNQKEVRRFLGCTGFFRKHIKQYSNIAAPLTSLTRKDAKFAWGQPEEIAFQSLKTALISAPVLSKPDFDRSFEIHTDASGVAIGACLMQSDDEGRLQPVAYFSRKLRDAETRYPAIDCEALAVVEGVRAFDCYVYGRRFYIYTDHRPLTYVFSRKTKSLRMTRWSHELSFYNYILKYKQGTQHRVPDQLSRAVAATELHNRDPDDLRRHQLEDPLWKEVIEYLEERNLPRRRLPLTLEEFELRDGVLYHVRHLPDRVLHQLVVPKTLRGSAMHLAHSSATAGHPGVYRTYCKLRDYFYFPNMLAAVKEYVGTCRSCQKRKGMAYRAPLAAAPQASYPLERVSADLMELEVTSQGNRYVLAFIDQLTRYVQLIPLPSKDAETVADAFINQFVTVFGPPRLLQTDNGREFKNNLFKRVCELASVQTIFTTAFHPQANGMIERTNRVVKNALATLLEASPLEWDELLPYVRLAMNSAVHRSVGDQPLYLLTGHIGTYPVGNSNYEETDHEAAQSFAARLRRAREIAVETSVQAREGWARDYNRRTRKSTFAAEVGDLVLFKDLPRMAGAGRRGALGPRWFGPARICKKTGPVTRLVRVLSPPYKEKIYHLNQLRPYRTNDELHLPDEDELNEDGDVDDPPPLDGLPEDDPAVALLASFCRPPDHG